MDPVPLSKIETSWLASPGSIRKTGTLLLASEMLVPIPRRSTVALACGACEAQIEHAGKGQNSKSNLDYGDLFLYPSDSTFQPCSS